MKRDNTSVNNKKNLNIYLFIIMYKFYGTFLNPCSII